MNAIFSEIIEFSFIFVEKCSLQLSDIFTILKGTDIFRYAKGPTKWG